ncbi:MAG: hypothetical protein QW705_04815 [Zestosphaera sp.]
MLSPEEMRVKLLDQLRNLGFGILTASEYQVASRLLTIAGVHRDVIVRRVPQTQYYVLEVDKRAFISECRNLARRNEVTSVSLLITCVESKKAETLGRIMEKLSQARFEGV